MWRALSKVAAAWLLVTAVVIGTEGCGKQRGSRSAVLPDSLPRFIGDSLPFRYPPGLYIQLIQDDVTLRLFIDEFGRPVPESTRIAERSQYAEFDSSALAGARDLVFTPASRDGKAIPYPVLFPIKFRVPGGDPMPSDTPTTTR